MLTSKRLPLLVHAFVLTTSVLACFLLASCGSINKIHCGAFAELPRGEDNENRNYVELATGEKVYGNKITYTSGFLSKNQVKVDDNKYPNKEVNGFYHDGKYTLVYKGNSFDRIVHGKLNVYYTSNWVTDTHTSMNTNVTTTSTRMVCAFFVQVGDRGPLKQIGGQKDIKEFVKDCPKAWDMANKSNKEIRRAIRADHFYLNEIFITYNDGCK